MTCSWDNSWGWRLNLPTVAWRSGSSCLSWGIATSRPGKAWRKGMGKGREGSWAVLLCWEVAEKHLPHNESLPCPWDNSRGLETETLAGLGSKLCS